MSESSPVSLHALVHGRVQNVGFRFFVDDLARSYGLTGFVRNLSYGRTVEVTAEGQRTDLETLLKQLHEGPPGAHVERVDASWNQATGNYDRFSIR
jgi:acylphosphatase